MLTTFNAFKDKLELMGRSQDRYDDWSAPINSIDEYKVSVDGNQLSIENMLHDIVEDKVYIPQADGSLEATEDYKSYCASEVHNWQLLKVILVEVE